MSIPLAAIGDATVEVIGLNLQGVGYRSAANWAEQAVFDDEPFYQPTGMGPRLITLHLAARPYVMGGMSEWQRLRRHHERRDVVPYIRMVNGLVGEVVGDVGVKELGAEETKIAPGGIGYRFEFEAQLIVLGRRAGGSLFGGLFG